jgi:hypothetical protein
MKSAHEKQVNKTNAFKSITENTDKVNYETEHTQR